MTRAAGRGKRTAALVTLPVLPIAWFVALQEQPPWMPAAYLGYLLLVIVVPGTMFWRRLSLLIGLLPTLPIWSASASAQSASEANGIIRS